MAAKKTKTRMHSSRMRTGRSLTVCCSLLPGEEGCLAGLGGFSLVRGGVCLVRGVSLPGGVGGSPWSGGVSLPGGCLPGPGGVSLPGGRGCSPWSRGVSLPGGWWVSAWSRGGVLRRPHPPMYRITDTCKNITLATTSLRPVKTEILFLIQAVSIGFFANKTS